MLTTATQYPSNGYNDVVSDRVRYAGPSVYNLPVFSQPFYHRAPFLDTPQEQASLLQEIFLLPTQPLGFDYCHCLNPMTLPGPLDSRKRVMSLLLFLWRTRIQMYARTRMKTLW